MTELYYSVIDPTEETQPFYADCRPDQPSTIPQGRFLKQLRQKVQKGVSTCLDELAQLKRANKESVAGYVPVHFRNAVEKVTWEANSHFQAAPKEAIVKYYTVMRIPELWEKIGEYVAMSFHADVSETRAKVRLYFADEWPAKLGNEGQATESKEDYTDVYEYTRVQKFVTEELKTDRDVLPAIELWPMAKRWDWKRWPLLCGHVEEALESRGYQRLGSEVHNGLCNLIANKNFHDWIMPEALGASLHKYIPPPSSILYLDC